MSRFNSDPSLSFSSSSRLQQDNDDLSANRKRFRDLVAALVQPESERERLDLQPDQREEAASPLNENVLGGPGSVNTPSLLSAINRSTPQFPLPLDQPVLRSFLDEAELQGAINRLAERDPEAAQRFVDAQSRPVGEGVGTLPFLTSLANRTAVPLSDLIFGSAARLAMGLGLEQDPNRHFFGLENLPTMAEAASGESAGLLRRFATVPETVPESLLNVAADFTGTGALLAAGSPITLGARGSGALGARLLGPRSSALGGLTQELATGLPGAVAFPTLTRAVGGQITSPEAVRSIVGAPLEFAADVASTPGRSLGIAREAKTTPEAISNISEIATPLATMAALLPGASRRSLPVRQPLERPPTPPTPLTPATPPVIRPPTPELEGSGIGTRPVEPSPVADAPKVVRIGQFGPKQMAIIEPEFRPGGPAKFLPGSAKESAEFAKKQKDLDLGNENKIPMPPGTQDFTAGVQRVTGEFKGKVFNIDVKEVGDRLFTRPAATDKPFVEVKRDSPEGEVLVSRLASPSLRSGPRPGVTSLGRAKQAEAQRAAEQLPRTNVGRISRALQNEVQKNVDRVFGARAAVKQAGQKAVMSLSRGGKDNTGLLGTFGEIGKELARDVNKTTFEIDRRIGTNNADFKDAMKAAGLKPFGPLGTIIRTATGKPSLPERVMMSLDGLIPETDLPRHVRTQLPKMREILNRDRLIARDLGQKLELPSGELVELPFVGNLVPQIPNVEGRQFLESSAMKGASAPEVFRFAVQQVKNGKFDTIEEAIAELQSFRERGLHQGYMPTFQQSRLELPTQFREFRPNVILPSVFERSATIVELGKTFGLEFQKLDSTLRRMIRAGEIDDGLAKQIADVFRIESGQKQVGKLVGEKLAKFFVNYELVTRIGLSPLMVLRNSGQPITNNVHVPFDIKLETLFRLPPLVTRYIRSSRELLAGIERSGALSGTSPLAIVESPGSKTVKTALRFFLGGEELNKARTAYMAARVFERNIQKLNRVMKGSPIANTMKAIFSLGETRESVLLRRLSESGVNNLSNEKLFGLLARGRPTPEQIQEAMFRMTHDTQFAMTLASRPIWVKQQPWLRLLTQFKQFGVRQTGLLYKDVAKEATRANIKPLVRFAAGTFLIGEVYNVASDFLFSRKRSVTNRFLLGNEEVTAEGLATAVIGNMVDGAFVGILADLTYGALDFIGGPAFGTFEDTLDAFETTLQRPKDFGKAIQRFLRREVSGVRQAEGLARRTEELFGPEDNENLFFESSRIRSMFFQFNMGRGLKDAATGKNFTLLRDTLTDIVAGREKFPSSANTATSQFVSRAIIVNDLDDAIKMVRSRIADASSVNERKVIIDALRRSLEKRGPLDVGNKEQRKAFLQALREREPEQARLAVNLQKEYERRVRLVMNAATRRAP